MHFIGRGAEAIIYRKNNHLIKKRITKGYRIPELDERIRKERTRREARLLSEARRAGIKVPYVISKNLDDARIEMEYIDGKTLREIFENITVKEELKFFKELGGIITQLHDANIVHGDLTTSNFVVYNNKIWIIDFGLGDFSRRTEDKAMDLQLFRSALKSKYSKSWKKLFERFIKNYNPKGKDKIIDRLAEIEKRRRYR